MKPNTSAQFLYTDSQPAEQDILAEVLAGLRASQLSISPKYFYDERGSQLFEAITKLPEYYVTRTELSLFDEHLSDIAEVIGPDCCVIEYGSGSTLKIRRVLRALRPAAYVPVDISGDYLLEGAQRLAEDFAELDIFPICADFTQHLALPEALSSLSKVGFFPGSSIGNFEPEHAAEFMRRVNTTLGPEGLLLIGVDCKKDVKILEAAYDDSEGVTAQFNLNALSNLNLKLGANFRPDRFEHVARYNESLGCIQMFLRSSCYQEVTLGGHTIEIQGGQAIHTENSYKYFPEEFLALAAEAGFAPAQYWLDDQQHFGLYLLRVAPEAN